MTILKTVIITILVYNVVTIILNEIDNSGEKVILFTSFPLYPIVRFLLYPIRAIRKWEKSKNFYMKHNINKWQYVFGKRIKKN